MIGKHKKFDQKLHKKYDIPAREVVKKCLGEFVCENPDKYGEDLLILSDTCKYKYLELQVCSNWYNDNYPYPYPFVYARKSVFSDKTLFLILDRNMLRGFLFDKESLKTTPKRLQKYSREFIYEVPWCRVIKIYMEHFNKDVIEIY